MKGTEIVHHLEQLFEQSREIIGRIDRKEISPLISIDELIEKSADRSSSEFIKKISDPDIVQGLISALKLPYSIIGSDDITGINFYQNQKGVAIPLDFIPQITDLMETYYNKIAEVWGHYGINLTIAKERFPITIDSAYRSPASQIWAICSNSICEETEDIETRRLSFQLRSTFLPHTSQHGKIPPAIDINEFQIGKNCNFKTYESLRTNAAWELFKYVAEIKGFAESYTAGSPINQGNGEPWHFLKYEYFF